MRTKGIHDPELAQRLRINLDETLGKNSLNKLVKPIQKLAKSIIEISSKVHKPKTYNEAVNNPINANK